jgi:hypothetical protein
MRVILEAGCYRWKKEECGKLVHEIGSSCVLLLGAFQGE